MSNIRVFILGIFTTLNLVFFSYALYNEKYLFNFIIIHAFTAVFYYAINYKYIKINKSKIPVFIIYIFPGLGFLVLFILVIVEKVVPSKTQQIEHITLVEKEDDFRVFSFLDANKVLSYSDSMKHLSKNDKMSFIFDVLDSTTIDKALVLRESLVGENYDLRYYSSIYLSTMSNQLEGEIFRLKRQYHSTDDIKILKHLLRVYTMYLTTDLLVGEIFDFFNDDYIIYLKRAIDNEIEVKTNIDRLIKAYLKGKLYDECYELLKTSFKKSPDNYDYNMVMFELYSRQKDYKKTKEQARYILSTYSSISDLDLSLLNYWGGEI